MTAEPVQPDGPEVVRFDAATEPRDRSQDRIPFALGDDDTVMYAVRPKVVILMDVAASLADSENVFGQARAVNEFIDKILDDDSRLYLRERFDDPDDDMDLDNDDLISAMEYVVGRWYGRPTGSRPGSPEPRSRSGKRSTAKRRSRG
jgi:hypothetical protein